MYLEERKKKPPSQESMEPKVLSYKSKKLNISTITRDLNIGTIELEIDTEFLNEIEVISEKKGVEFKNNKIIFNVERDISSAGSSATEILNNIPSINFMVISVKYYNSR